MGGDESFRRGWLHEEGQRTNDATDQLKDGVRKIEGLKILGTPHMTCFAIGAADPEIDIQAVADVMDGKGLNFNGIIQIRYFKPLNINQRTYTCILNA